MVNYRYMLQSNHYMTKTYPFDTRLMNEFYYSCMMSFTLLQRVDRIYGGGPTQNKIYMGCLPCEYNKDFLIVCIDLKNKNKCYIHTGFRNKSRLRFYADIKINCKFKKLIDEYYDRFVNDNK